MSSSMDSTPAVQRGERLHQQVLFNEDTCALKRDPSKVGIVDRVWHDVDSHRPFFPSESPEFDESVPAAQRQSLLETGLLPRGYVVVQFSDMVMGSRMCPETELVLMDRSFSFGDVVKRKASDQMSGTVVRNHVECDLRPSFFFPSTNDLPTANTRNPNDLLSSQNTLNNLHDIPAEELSLSGKYHEGDFVIYRDWVGIVEDFDQEVTVQLEDGSVVVVEDAMDLELPVYNEHTSEFPSHDESRPNNVLARSRRFLDTLRAAGAHSTTTSGRSKTVPAEHLSPGQVIITKKGNLRRGRWKHGSYDPNVRPHGLVIEVHTIWLWVRWLCSDVMTPKSSDERAASVRPLEQLDPREGEGSGSFCRYDKGKFPSKESSGLDSSERYGSTYGADLQVSDIAQFRDLTGASVKYNGQTAAPDGQPHGRLVKAPQLAHQGYDIDSFVVTRTTSKVTVQWQDLSKSLEDSITLIPYLNVDDRDVWPGEIVLAKGEQLEVDGNGTVDSSQDGVHNPRKVGVVQSVDAVERMAKVRWYKDPSIGLTGPEQSILLPGSKTGQLGEETEDVSVYELMTVPALSRRRGDFIIFESRSNAGHTSETGTPVDWFGQIVDLRTDGLVTVRLGALDEVRDVNLRMEQLLVVYGEDDEDDEDVSDSADDDMDGQYEVWDEEVLEERVEYEGGERLDQDGGDELWLTDDASLGEDSDTSMADANGRQASVSETAGGTATVGDEEPEVEAVSEDGRMTDIEGAEASRPGRLLILDSDPPADHAFNHCLGTGDVRRIRKEHKILESSLPEGIWVRTWESRLDFLRVLIVGPRKTPYALAPFVFDFHFGEEFPAQPPAAYFHSWTNGYGRINPNLYEDGKVCLSILGTWPADARNEGWAASRSTVLQILVSLMGLVLVKEPYYNEAGFDVLVGTEESRVASSLYTERAYLLGRAFVTHVLAHPVAGLADVISWLYLPLRPSGPNLLREVVDQATEVLRRSDDKEATSSSSQSQAVVDEGGVVRVSGGAALLLKKHLAALQDILKDKENDGRVTGA